MFCYRTAVERLIRENLQPVMRGVQDWVSDAYRRHVVYSEEIDMVVCCVVVVVFVVVAATAVRHADAVHVVAATEKER
jgi:hypothetical protein